MKIGIMTFFRPINYGAYLQAYAFVNRLNQENNIEAEIINYHMPEEDWYYNKKTKGKNLLKDNFNRKKIKIFQNVRQLLPLSNEQLCSNDSAEFISFVNGKYDAIIAGSDEIWKVNGYRGFPLPYFLPGDLNCKKISYAASGRIPFKTESHDNQKLLKELLDDFDYIGVRDQATYNEVKQIISEKDKVHVNYDPTFVYDFNPDKKRGKDLLKKYFHISDNKKVIALLYDENIRENPSLEKYLKDKYSKEFNFISLCGWSVYFKNYPQINPFEWIDIIAAVDGVISMYFHGICFSIISGTPFYAVDRASKSSSDSKLYDLLYKLDLIDYFALGVKNAINDKGLDSLFNTIREGERWDFSSVLDQAKLEFDQFINELESIVIA